MFAVPHGIAVSMGMHVACSVASARDLLQASHAERMQQVLAKNFSPYAAVQIEIQPMMAALMKDKKNSTSELGLILPIGERAEIQKIMIEPDAQFQQQLADSLSALR
jgi:3-dehydroquinate synthase